MGRTLSEKAKRGKGDYDGMMWWMEWRGMAGRDDVCDDFSGSEGLFSFPDDFCVSFFFGYPAFLHLLDIAAKVRGLDGGGEGPCFAGKAPSSLCLGLLREGVQRFV